MQEEGESAPIGESEEGRIVTMTSRKAGGDRRQRGGGMHRERGGNRRADLIVPRGSNLPGAAKYRLLSRARRRAQEAARRVLVAVATWAVLATSATLAQTVEGEFERTIAVGGGALVLDVRTGSGRIAVTVGEPGIARVVGHIRGYADGWTPDAPAVVADRVRTIEIDPPIVLDGDVLRVGHLDRSRHRQVGISYELLVPASTTVRARTGTGDVRVEGVTGAVDARTGSGSIELTAIGGDVDVRTGAGPIGITGLDTALLARAGTGRIRVAGAPGGPWALSTGSGGIQVSLPDDAAFEIDARTHSGEVRTEHPVVAPDEARRGQLQGTVRGGGPRVTLRTGSGSIAIE